MTGGRQALGRLAAELGVQRAYTDIAGRRRTASAAALAAVCTALGWRRPRTAGARTPHCAP